MHKTPARLLSLPVFLLCLVTACGSGTGQQGGASEAPGRTAPSSEEAGSASTTTGALSSRQGDLRAYLLKSVRITAPKSDGFREPGGTELVAFERALQQVLVSNDPGATRELDSLGYSVSTFSDDNGGAWLLLEEKASSRRGGGTFVLNLDPARDLWLEAPHADSDEGTLEESIDQLVSLGARGLLITGSNRCASTATTACGETNTVFCDGSLRISDSAHHPYSFFTAAHRALRALYPSAVAVSLHGMEQKANQTAIISDGTSLPRASSLSVRLRDALNQRMPASNRAFSCNDPSDNGKHRGLCGLSNIQGRIDNGASDACYQEAPASADRFLHVEQGPALRLPGEPGRLTQAVAEALAETVPCSLPGKGLGCAVAHTSAP
jgi:hypothetical protein